MDSLPLSSIVIYWKGPFTREEIHGDWEHGNGLYLLAGQLSGRKKSDLENEIRYCGITENSFHQRFQDKRHKINLIRSDSLSIWLGKLVFPPSHRRESLELAEACFIKYWGAELNQRKRIAHPNPICLVSQWLSKNGKVRLRRPAIARDVPDVIWWDGERWRTGKLTIWAPE